VSERKPIGTRPTDIVARDSAGKTLRYRPRISKDHWPMLEASEPSQ